MILICKRVTKRINSLRTQNAGDTKFAALLTMKLIHALAIVLSLEVSSIDPVRVVKGHLRRDLQDEQEQFGADPSTLALESMSMVSMVSSSNMASKSSKSSKSKTDLGDPPSGDIDLFWYKPHWQCGIFAGGKPQPVADFINSQMVKVDFAGIGEWEAKIPIGRDACRWSIDRTGGGCNEAQEDWKTIKAS